MLSTRHGTLDLVVFFIKLCHVHTTLFTKWKVVNQRRKYTVVNQLTKDVLEMNYLTVPNTRATIRGVKDISNLSRRG